MGDRTIQNTHFTTAPRLSPYSTPGYSRTIQETDLLRHANRFQEPRSSIATRLTSGEEEEDETAARVCVTSGARDTRSLRADSAATTGTSGAPRIFSLSIASVVVKLGTRGMGLLGGGLHPTRPPDEKTCIHALPRGEERN